MNTKADFSDSLTSVEVVLDEAESYARIDGANIADSLSTERAESNAIVLEEGNGVYAMMGEHAFEVLSLGSGSEHKSCAPVNGEGLGTRFMWSKATNDTQQKMNTKPDFSDGPASFEGALNEAESYARIDGDDIAGSLSPERAESNAIVSEEGDGVYVMMGEDAVEVPPLRSGSEDKSCAPVNGKGAGTRFMWLKWGRQQLRKQLDSTSATTAAKNNVSRSKLGSKWANISVLKWHSSNEPKIVSNKHGIKLGLRLSRKTSNDDQSVTSFEEDRLDGQKRRNYDWFFTVLFLFHIGVTLFFFAIGTRAGYGSIAYLIIECFAFAAAVSISIFTCMMKFAGKWLRSSLTVSLTIFSGVLVLALWGQEFVPCITLLVIFVLSFTYCAYSWKRLPFIAAIFNTAVSVIKSNTSLCAAAFIIQLAAVAWSIVWIVTCTWAIKATSLWIGLLFLISYFWVEEVLKNIMHVSAARLVGKWWLSPGGGHPDRFVHVLRKSCTTLFGSICFGSLFVNFFLGLRKLLTYKYEKKGGDSVLLIFVHDASFYMSKWGFVYVGLCEYPFFQAGKEVSELFKEKGWHELIADDLTDNVLLIINLAVATSTGAFAWLISTDDSYYYLLRDPSFYHPYTAEFFVGFFTGFLVSSIMTSAFGGVANAIIVCFAEHPKALGIVHPSQFEMLLDGWTLGLPEELKELKAKKCLRRRMEEDNVENGVIPHMVAAHEKLNDMIIDLLTETDRKVVTFDDSRC